MVEIGIGGEENIKKIFSKKMKLII